MRYMDSSMCEGGFRNNVGKSKLWIDDKPKDNDDYSHWLLKTTEINQDSQKRVSSMFTNPWLLIV